jgi:hypothetical protein
MFSSVVSSVLPSALPARFAFSMVRALGVAIALASCGDPRASFTTKVASDFPPSGHTVSVLGVFKEGRMSPETWGELGAGLSSAFGPSACPAEYSDDLVTSNAPLSAAIDDYARANGVGDELLDALAPAATGDLIAVFTMAGKVTPDGHAGGATTGAMPPTAPNTMTRGGTGFRGQHGGMPGMGGPMTDPRRGFRPASGDALELSASLFSVSQHKSVALVAMSYVGDSIPDALAELAARLRAALPGSTCAAWNGSVHLDEQRIRELTER